MCRRHTNRRVDIIIVNIFSHVVMQSAEDDAELINILYKCIHHSNSLSTHQGFCVSKSTTCFICVYCFLCPCVRQFVCPFVCTLYIRCNNSQLAERLSFVSMICVWGQALIYSCLNIMFVCMYVSVFFHDAVCYAIM